MSVESDMNENFVREPNVHMMLQSVLSYAYFSKNICDEVYVSN